MDDQRNNREGQQMWIAWALFVFATSMIFIGFYALFQNDVLVVAAAVWSVADVCLLVALWLTRPKNPFITHYVTCTRARGEHFDAQ
jgi:lipopolysaccharide export LptBFGC system permease protein LptF